MPLFPNARYLCSAKELSRGKNSERYRALWLDSLLPVIEAGQLETVDVATRPRVGGRIDFIPSITPHVFQDPYLATDSSIVDGRPQRTEIVVIANALKDSTLTI